MTNAKYICWTDWIWLKTLQYFSKFSLRWSQQKSLVLSYIHFILQATCITAASLIQYFFLVTFSWMLIEGIQLYHKVTKVAPVQLNMPLCYVLSYGKGITYFTDKFSARLHVGVLIHHLIFFPNRKVIHKQQVIYISTIQIILFSYVSSLRIASGLCWTVHSCWLAQWWSAYWRIR